MKYFIETKDHKIIQVHRWGKMPSNFYKIYIGTIPDIQKWIVNSSTYEKGISYGLKTIDNTFIDYFFCKNIWTEDD